ncbi:unnamed protein product [Bathycoccus prasinos]
MCKLGDHSDWITLADDKSGRLLVWDWVDEVCICRRGGHEVSGHMTTKLECGTLALGSVSKCSIIIACRMERFALMICFVVETSGFLQQMKNVNLETLLSTRSQICGRLLEIFAGHEAPISTICLSGGSLLISGSWDKTVRFWDIFKGKQTEMLEHTSDILSIATRFDSEQIAVATGDGHIVLWNKRNAEIVGTLENTTEELKYRRGEVQDKENAFQSIIYNSDGTLIYAAGIGLCIIIFDVVSRSVIRRLGLQYNHIILRGQAETQIVKSLSLSPDGSTLSVSTPMGVATYQKVMKTIFPSFENSFYEENVNTKSVLIAIEARNYTAALLMILRVKTDVNFTMAIINCIPISQRT